MTSINSVSSYQPLYSLQQTMGNQPQPAARGESGGSSESGDSMAMAVNHSARMPEQSQLQTQLQTRVQEGIRPAEQQRVSSVAQDQTPAQNQTGVNTPSQQQSSQLQTGTRSQSNGLTPTLQALAQGGNSSPPSAGTPANNSSSTMAQSSQDMNVNEQVRQNVSRLMEFSSSQARGGNASAYNSFSASA